MVVYEGPGDVFKHDEGILLVPVNIDGIMGKGIAAYIRSRYPEVYRRYRVMCKEGRFSLNSLMLFDINPDLKLLLIPTKHHWYDVSTTELLEQNLRKLVESVDRLGNAKIYSPALGCGQQTGTLEYRKVRHIFRYWFDRIPNEVYIYNEWR